jgi:hypothetical protein
MSLMDPPDWQRDKSARPFQGTQLRYKWSNRVKGEISNDFVVVVTPHSSTAGSGTGKTTLALQLCKAFDQSSRGFDAETNATLDAGALTEELLDESESGSALLWDEAQGAPGTDGLDARRAMKSEPMNAIKGVLAARNQRHTLVVIGQQIGMFDPRLYPMIDAWIHIVVDPGQRGPPTAVHYDLIADDYDLSSRDYKSKNIEDLSWSALPEDDPDYRTMDRLKEEAKTNDEEEEEDDTRSVSELAQEIVNMEPEKQANFISWHGGWNKWRWAQDRFRRGFDVTHRRARGLKDHLVEVTDLTPEEIADAAGKERPE